MDERPAPVPGAGLLALLALVWLMATLTAARLAIGDSPGAGLPELTRTVLELPRVAAASAVAGTAVAVWALELLSRRTGGTAPRRAITRLATAAGAGLLPGVGVAVPVVVGYAGLPYVPVLAGTAAAAAVLGGLVAALPVRAAVAAGTVGALGMLLVGFVAGRLDADLRALFGGGDTPQGVLAASGRVVLAVALVAGAVAGAGAYAYLSRAGRRLGWTAYLTAGALPGGLALLAEVVARFGAVPVVRLISEADRTVWSYLGAVRVNHGLIVLFAGALAAILLLGHVRRPADPASPAGSTGPAGPDAGAAVN